MAKVRSLVISCGKFLEFLKELHRSILNDWCTKRVCKLCTLDEVENEFHLLFNVQD